MFANDAQRRAMFARLNGVDSGQRSDRFAGLRDQYGRLDSISSADSLFSKAENVSRGKRLEQKIHARLGRSNSVVTMRSVGSRGLWDMVAITPDKVRLVQAKTHGYIEPAERDEMLVQLQHMPDNVQAELEYYVSPRVTKNFTLKKAGETDWDKVEERLEHFAKVRGFRKSESDKKESSETKFSHGRFTRPDYMKGDRRYVAVDVDLGKLNRAWKRNPDNYFEEEFVSSPERYEHVVDFIKEGKRIDMPEVYAEPDMDSIKVADGRHRIAAMRDLGRKRMDILVPEFQKDYFVHFK